MAFVDSPDPDYLQKGGPSEKKAPWWRRYGWRLILVLLDLFLLGVVVTAVVVRPDLFRSYGGLTGQVFDTRGLPLTTARVFVSNVEQWITVDAQGRFKLDHIPTGQTFIVVINQSGVDVPGGTPLSRAVVIEADQIADLGPIVIEAGP